MHRRVSSILIVTALFVGWLVMPAWAGGANEVSTTDAYKRPLTMTQAPRRVVSLVPGVTEMLLALGVGDTLQGVTYYDRVPPQVGKPAVVGGFFSPITQVIAQCQPDCIFVSDIQKEVQERFKDSGIPVIHLEAHTVSDIFANLRLLGAMFQRQEQAEALCRQIQDKMDLIREKVALVPDSRRVRALRLMSDRQMVVPGDDSFQNDYIRQAGGIPPCLGKKGAIVPITFSEWQQFNPQVIFTCGSDLKQVEKLVQQPGWQEVEAVRQGRIYRFPCELTCRASVHAGDFVAWLAATLYLKDFADPKNRLRSDQVLASEALTLDLPYVRQARVTRSRIMDFEQKSLVIDFKTPVAVISTLEGPRQGILTVGNHYTPPPCWGISHYLGLAKDRAQLYRVLKKTGQNTSFLFTGADMANLSVQQSTFKDIKVYALVTAGVEGNALRLSQDEGRFYEPGTINIILLTNCRLTPRAMSRALIAATEAKTAALQDLDIRSSEHPLTYQATGTGTDNIIVVEGRGPAIDNVGGHSKMGELIGRAVYQGVREAVAKQNGITSCRSHWQRLQERRLGLYELVRNLPGTSQAQIVPLWESVMLEPHYSGFMETAFALSDAYERGQVLDLSSFADYCKMVARELAGKPVTEWQTISFQGELPRPLHMACEAFINGLVARAQPGGKP
ncbi:MAG: adenosylcobinamide amidohydrolase [Deltaproteobacteria bacterium]|nr:adenosylcobinamide amidohydrolase [Deltaproteobacteria bacterium]